MDLSKEQWLERLEAKCEDARAEISLERFESEGRAFVAALGERLDRELVVLAVEAQQQADMYWAANASAREDAEEEQGRMGTRVRIVGSTLVAEWYRNRFFDRGGGSARVLSTYIRKGRASAYDFASFRRLPRWEREVIEVVEGRYAMLRRRAGVLAKIRRALGEYERLLGESYRPEGGDAPESGDDG